MREFPASFLVMMIIPFRGMGFCFSENLKIFGGQIGGFYEKEDVIYHKFSAESMKLDKMEEKGRKSRFFLSSFL